MPRLPSLTSGVLQAIASPFLLQNINAIVDSVNLRSQRKLYLARLLQDTLVTAASSSLYCHMTVQYQRQGLCIL